MTNQQQGTNNTTTTIRTT